MNFTSNRCVYDLHDLLLELILEELTLLPEFSKNYPLLIQVNDLYSQLMLHRRSLPPIVLIKNIFGVHLAVILSKECKFNTNL